MSFFKKTVLLFLLSLFLILIIFFSEISASGIKKGIIISANIIIPSLFPFTVFVLIILKSGFTVKNKFLNNIIYKIFGLNFEMFFVFILSLIGGYPIGAKLIAELYHNKKLNKKSANIMLMYCVNAGPAFIISAIGIGLFKSNTVGIILLVSHLLSSLIAVVILSKNIKGKIATQNFKGNVTSVSKIFVDSITDAARSMLQICSFIVFFSAIAAYFEYFLTNVPIINKISYFLEVTTAVTKTDNIIFVSFLLGFSGISIWFQIFAITKEIGVTYYQFIFGRILHGGISSVICYIILYVFKIEISVFNNGISFHKKTVYTNIPITLSLIAMTTVLLIYIYSKNSSRKLLDDMV